MSTGKRTPDNSPSSVEERLSFKEEISEDHLHCRNNENVESTFRRDEYSYDGQYDNLLFFFRFMYSKIHTLYDHDQLKSYKRRLE